MKTLFKSIKLIQLGFLLGVIFVAWLEDDKKEKEKSDPYDFNNYKHNHYKDNANA